MGLAEWFINYPCSLSLCLFILMCVYTYNMHILNIQHVTYILKWREAVAKDRNMYECMYIHFWNLYECMYIYSYVYKRAHVHMYRYTQIHMCVFIYMHTYTHQKCLPLSWDGLPLLFPTLCMYFEGTRLIGSMLVVAGILWAWRLSSLP